MSLVSKFDSMGFVNDLHSGRAMDVEKHEETKNQLKVLIKANPKLSLRKAASVVGVSHMTVRTIFIDELHLKPYKYQMCHELKPSDYEARLEFARWFLSKPENITQYFIVSDEAYFYLKEALNKQNDRMWSESRPDEWIEAPLHDEKIHVWCAISAKRIFGPFYFEESVKAINYLEMLKRYFWPKLLRTADHDKYYFQQDGAPSHTAGITQEWGVAKFGTKFINKGMWPPRSPDLNPCDYFLWGYLKSVVYNPLPRNLEELKVNIEREIRKIQGDVLKKLFLNLRKRCDYVISAGGGHFENK